MLDVTNLTAHYGTSQALFGIDLNLQPGEVATLLGDPTKAKEKLGWAPTTTLEELVAEMVATDVEEAKKEAYLRLKGFDVVGAKE